MVGRVAADVIPERDSLLNCFQIVPVGVVAESVEQVSLHAWRLVLRMTVLSDWHLSL